MKQVQISVIVIAKNEERKIGECFDSLLWADELILVDSGSIDKTVEIAQAKGAKVIKAENKGYSFWRNKGLREAKGKWIFYVDADERVPNNLRDEIRQILVRDDYNAYAIPRKNIILGRFLRNGGWWPDYVKRLFKRSTLRKWVGDLHEEPVFIGKLGYLRNPLLHIKHDSLSEMIEKTNKWSDIEAKLLFLNNHPKMSWWRFVRIMLTEFWYRMIMKKAFLDGPIGIIYAIYQSWSRFITYSKLWEMQIENQNPKSKISSEIEIPIY